MLYPWRSERTWSRCSWTLAKVKLQRLHDVAAVADASDVSCGSRDCDGVTKSDSTSDGCCEFVWPLKVNVSRISAGRSNTRSVSQDRGDAGQWRWQYRRGASAAGLGLLPPWWRRSDRTCGTRGSRMVVVEEVDRKFIPRQGEALKADDLSARPDSLGLVVAVGAESLPHRPKLVI
jgi:hypothetical protein